jgi:hypothetical protein
VTPSPAKSETGRGRTSSCPENGDLEKVFRRLSLARQEGFDRLPAAPIELAVANMMGRPRHDERPRSTLQHLGVRPRASVRD